MPKSSSFSFLPDLQMPLRDALRGAATLADATKEILEPAAKLLPEAMQSRFQHALVSLEKAGKRITHSRIDTDQIRSASRFLIAAETDAGAIRDCATVLVHAWEHLSQSSVRHRHLISETIVSDRLNRTRAASALSGADFAAAVVTTIRMSSAIGLMPGLARAINADEEIEVDVALLAIAVWLMSTRAGSLDEEEMILDLALALVRALQHEIKNPFGDPAQLARFLSDTAAHL